MVLIDISADYITSRPHKADVISLGKLEVLIISADAI